MADDKALLNRLRTALVPVLCCPADNITPDADLVDDLNADDLDIEGIFLAIEEEWDLAGVPEDEADKWRTVGDILTYLKTLPEIEED